MAAACMTKAAVANAASLYNRTTRMHGTARRDVSDPGDHGDDLFKIQHVELRHPNYL